MLKRAKRFFALLLAVAFIFGASACKNGKNEDMKQSDVTTSVEKEVARDSILKNTAGMLLNSIPKPTYGSVGGEWLVFGIARWGDASAKEWLDGYYEVLESHVKECKGVLDARKYTEYSRVILALTAIDKDPTNVGGYNLIAPLSDYDKTVFQGINGPVYALLALDMGNYEIPKIEDGNTQATKEKYVDYILSKEVEGGGWSLSGGEADADITAMVLQALSKYRKDEDVKAAIERGLDSLSNLQNENGGFSSYGVENSESISQVIVALTELGISIEDSRFVKNGNTLEDRLLDYMSDDYGFKHVLDGESDMMATEQAFYALVSVERMESGMTSLYSK